MEITRVQPEGFAEEEMPFVPAVMVRGGSTIYLSGATAFPLYHKHPHDEDELRVPEDIGEQTRLALENLRRVLASCGATFDNVVKVVIYNTDMDRQDTVNEIYRSYFTNGPPARSHVGVDRLVSSNVKIEIDMVAVVPDR